jgi:hypothetical protein
MDKRIFVLGATAIVSASAGVAGGYVWARRRLFDEFNEKLEKEISAYKWSYDKLQKLKADKKPTVDEQAAANGHYDLDRREAPMRTGPMEARPDEPAQDTLERTLAGLKNWDTGEREQVRMSAAEAMAAYSAGAVQADKAVTILDRFQKPSILGLGYTDEEVAEKSLFPDEASEEDEDLTRFRRPGHPYVISTREFSFGQTHNQSELTWYEEDQVLSDDQDMPVPDVDGVVGLDNMDRFGLGSGDPNLVYIQNDKIGAQFEVFRNQGSYAQIVHGAAPAPDKRNVKRRPKDD